MSQYISVPQQQNYEALHAQWESFAEPKPIPEPLPPTPYDSRQVVKPETVDSQFGHITAAPGMNIMSSTSSASDVFVVHPDDLANPNLWQLVP